MHNSSCPKCGVSFSGEGKTCGSCGAVSSRNPVSYLSLFFYYYHHDDETCVTTTIHPSTHSEGHRFAPPASPPLQVHGMHALEAAAEAEGSKANNSKLPQRPVPTKP
ncbi:hypothetical protein F4823DRAFT_596186 [Ustulina deusta]|nr:hypothetical protein F4823DRAFT_596186 [Ustulina deusta]